MNLLDKISDGSKNLRLYAKRLEKLDILTYQDLLYHLPYRYEDYSILSKIAELQEGELVTVHGKITKLTNTYTRSRKTLQKITIADDTGELSLTWFNQPFIVNNLKVGDSLSLAGKVEVFNSKPTIISPIYELLSPHAVHTGRIIPIYRETKGISSKWIRKQIFTLLEDLRLDDFLPQSVLDEHKLPGLIQSLKLVHFPNSLEQADSVRRRLAFDEIFLLQLTAMQRKEEWQKSKTAPQIHLSQLKLADLKKSLPFQLTPSQELAVTDILTDLQNNKPMNRLLQGDVGSGKTVVAAIGIYASFLNGYQSVIMAPTEILALQHFKTLSDLLNPFSLKIGLATSGSKIKKDKTYDLIVGTHALVAKSVNFDKIGLVVIDEQQRFGVDQRGTLRQKGDNPHLLTMTATPIPRTIALTLYGELDTSYLTDMPKGRQKVKTWLVPNEKRENAYKWIENEIYQNNSQVFIICPFVEPSESMQTVKAATKEFQRLQKNIFPKLKLAMLHGKLKSKEKEKILNDFKNKKIDVLVATPVVEVGIDIPNATIMLIEGGERFGLSQLHQLRGRVGRGDKQSYCLLFTDSTSSSALGRLRAMETMSQGAALAEFDLKMRGPGDLYGIRQSGTRVLKIASFSDTDLLGEAKGEAIKIFPNLSLYPKLNNQITSTSTLHVNPD